MKILHVIDTTGPGGAETLFIELCKRFNEGGFSSSALLRGPGWVQTQLRNNAIPEYVADCKGSFNIKFLIYLMRLIKSQKIELIQSHLLGSNVYCSLAGWLTGTPVVSTFHGSVDVARNERFLAAKFALVNRSSEIVCVSDNLLDDLAKKTPLNLAKVSIIRNGIDCRRFNTVRHDRLKAQYGLPENAFLVGSLGNIRPAKDYATALRALALTVARASNAYLLIAGDIKHDLHGELLSLAAELKITERVRFVGFYEPPEQFLEGLDLYLLSSKSEGHPFSVIQAMATGLPILATRCGVESMLSDGEDAVLVDTQNPQQMADAIVDLINSPDRRTALGIKAREHALNNYDFSVTANSYADLYRRATGKLSKRHTGL